MAYTRTSLLSATETVNNIESVFSERGRKMFISLKYTAHERHSLIIIDVDSSRLSVSG